MSKILIRILGVYLNTLVIVCPKLAAKKGFELFCWPRRLKMKPHQLTFLDQADEKITFQYAGKKVQCYRWGRGEKKILLLHGWRSHTYWWRYIINRLPKEEYTVYSLDAPGHGQSEGHYLNLLHYSTLIEEWIKTQYSWHAILAHSFGGFASVYALYKSPQLKVSKVVLLATAGDTEAFINHYNQLLGLSNKLKRLMMNYFVDTLGHPPAYYKIVEFGKSLQLPGLIIHDREDRDTPYQIAEDLHAVWKNTQLITTTGLGHNLKSKELIEKVVDFL